MTDIVPPGSIAGILAYWLAPPLAETATPVGPVLKENRRSGILGFNSCSYDAKCRFPRC
jgi:hypothetical protein